MIPLLYVFEVLFVIVCVFLVLLILIQKGRGGGLASAFGGAGGQTAFGSKTGDVLTWATSVVFGIFLILAVFLNLVANHIDKARGGNTSTVALTPAQRSTLPQPQLPEPGITRTGTSNTSTDTLPGTPPNASMSSVGAAAPTVAAPTITAPTIAPKTMAPTTASISTPTSLP